ncbi:alpha/beta fold hydrolase, partial [Halapricum sp. CBA1109]|uniref:alpha/beta fold hydrolase n=1 Tax=Halapricum sp. CBA1109 TaxID=2668068 RepID=UPI0012F96DAC
MARAATETTREAGTETVTRPDGRTVWYATYGPVDGRPVLCCHGTPGARVFGELLVEDARAAGVRLLVPDRPGYGRSDHDPDRTPTSTARDLRAVLDHAGVETADVVAFSGGACYALALAEADADSVASLTLVSGAVPPSLSAGRPRQLRLLSAMAERTPRLLGAVLRGQRWLAGRRPSVVAAQYTN